MKVTVDIRSAGLSAQFERAAPIAAFAAGQQALKDCNYFCKQDMDSLIKSSHIHSHMEGNAFVIRWVTPYAAYQYELPNTRTDRNPNARPHWCQAAHTVYGSRWQRVFANALHGEGL